MSKKRKKSKAVPVVIVLTILFAAAAVACFYAGDWVATQKETALQKVQEQVEAHNEEERSPSTRTSGDMFFDIIILGYRLLKSN